MYPCPEEHPTSANSNTLLSSLQHQQYKGMPCAATHQCANVSLRCAGVKRIAAGFFGEAQLALRDWLERIVHDAVIVTEHGRRHTVVLSDMLVALKRNGR